MHNEDQWAELDNNALFREYKRTGDPEMKNTLVLRYSYLVKNVALQLRGLYLSFAQVDDIINEGIILLMTAVDKFDLDKNVRFETYIAKRLRGMIVDLARREDWMPRSMRKNLREIDDAAGELFRELGRRPTPEEVADRVGLTESRYQKVLATNALSNVISLDKMMDERDKEPQARSINHSENMVQPEQNMQEREFYEVLHQGIEQLRDNEKMVLSLYYQKSLQMKEIATVMGVSAARVSQIHSHAIQKLRTHMTDYINS